MTTENPLDRVPHSIQVRLAWAGGVLQERKRQLDQARQTDRMFDGDGRYAQEVRDRSKGGEVLASALRRIAEFREEAPAHGVDVEAALLAMGITPELLTETRED